MSEPAGKPPKSVEQIRAALSSVHESGEGDAAGPLAEGLGAEDQLHIESFHDADVCRSFQRALSREGIPSTVVTRGRMRRVSVDAEDRERAHEVFKRHSATNPDRKPRGIRLEYDYMFFGAVIGSVLGAIVIAGSFRDILSTIPVLLFALMGAMCGHLADRVRGAFRRTHRVRLGLWEFLLLMAIPAFLMFLIKVVPKLMLGE